MDTLGKAFAFRLFLEPAAKHCSMGFSVLQPDMLSFRIFYSFPLLPCFLFATPQYTQCSVFSPHLSSFTGDFLPH